MSQQDKPLGVAVVGAGVIGALHAQIVSGLARTRLAVTVDPATEKARALAERYGGDTASDISQALRRDDVDIVAVGTPSGAHAEIAVPALAAGKHVMIEKPIDVIDEAVDAIVGAAAAGTGVATVISQHRFDPASQRVKQALGTDAFGTLVSGVADISWWRSQEYYDSGDWRGTKKLDGGGALMNQGIHTVDLLVWFLGEPVEVFAWTANRVHTGIEVEDVAVATIRFASGVVGSIHGTTAAYPGLTTRVQVDGDRGAAVIAGDLLTYFHAAGQEGRARFDYGAGEATNQVEDPVEAGVVRSGPLSATTAASDPTVFGVSHTVQWNDFLDAIKSGTQPLVTVAEGARTYDVIAAVYASAQTGQPVGVRRR